jgi:hypothetical protein
MKFGVGIILIAATACVSGCTSISSPATSRPPASERNKSIADNFYANCLAKAIARYDDHRTDTSVIALGVEHTCKASFDMTIEMNTRGLNDQEKQAFYKRATAAELPTITQMIDEERSAADK